MEIDYKQLMDMALIARGRAYAPYSDFTVGAALLTKSGKIYTGCNVENSSYGATICAERVALTKAISEGETSFTAIAIAGGKQREADITVTPCGVCLQFMSELCDKDFEIVLLGNNCHRVFKLGELLPRGFKL